MMTCVSACVIYPFMLNCEIFLVMTRDCPHVEFDNILLLFTVTRNQVCENDRGPYMVPRPGNQGQEQ